MSKQVVFTKSVVGWYNARLAGGSEILATIPPEALEKLLPNFKAGAAIVSCEVDMKKLSEVLRP